MQGDSLQLPASVIAGSLRSCFRFTAQAASMGRVPVAPSATDRVAAPQPSEPGETAATESIIPERSPGGLRTAVAADRPDAHLSPGGTFAVPGSSAGGYCS